MHRFSSLFKSRKGAAMAEYLPLLALISVVVIFSIVQFSSSVDEVFGDVTASIAEVGDPTTPPGPGPDPTPPGGPDGGPDTPVFPPPVVPPTGLEHGFTYDVYLSYWDATSITFDQIAQAIEAEAVDARAAGNTPMWYYSGNPPANWDADVTWSGIVRSEPYPDPNAPFPYNEVVFTTAGFTHNIGPLAGWGDGPEEMANCLADFPASEQYELRGYLSNGDRILVYLNLPPEECLPNHFVSRDVVITHSSSGAMSYGIIANTELAGVSSLDWTQATWSVTYLDQPTTGQIFSGLGMTTTGYVYNQLPGPAWQDADTGYSSCYEGAPYANGEAVGIHPDGEMVTLGLQFISQIGDTTIPGGDPTCYNEFGGP